MQCRLLGGHVPGDVGSFGQYPRGEPGSVFGITCALEVRFETAHQHGQQGVFRPLQQVSQACDAPTTAEGGLPKRLSASKGTAPALRAVVTGESDLTVASALAAQQHIDSGALRPLAVYGAQSMPQFPNVPTLSRPLAFPS